MNYSAKKINIFLAILAVLAGISAAFTHHAEKNELYPAWKFRSERIDTRKLRLISANHMADMVYNNALGWIILDARAVNDYETYHIPGAIPYSEEGLSSALNSNDKTIIYGKEDFSYLSEIPEKITGKIYHLDGGMEEWYRMVLFPDFNHVRVRNKKKLEDIIKRCAYFGGKPLNAEHLNIYERHSRFREGC